MKKILVTGAGGLVGYNVAKVLSNNLDYQVIAAVHNTNIEDLEKAVQIDLQKKDIEIFNVDLTI